MCLIGKQIPHQSARKNCAAFWARFQRRWSGLLLPWGGTGPGADRCDWFEAFRFGQEELLL